jgi:hypothetical protein
MNSKNHGQRRKWRFQPMGLIFYCYLLIPLNELAINVLIINKIKNEKKIIDIINRSIQNAEMSVSCHIDGRRYLVESGLNALILV